MFNIHLSFSSFTHILNDSVLQPQGSTQNCGRGATAARTGQDRGPGECPYRVEVGGAWHGVSRPKDPRGGCPGWGVVGSPLCRVGAQAGEGGAHVRGAPCDGRPITWRGTGQRYHRNERQTSHHQREQTGKKQPRKSSGAR